MKRRKEKKEQGAQVRGSELRSKMIKSQEKAQDFQTNQEDLVDGRRNLKGT